MKLPRFYPILDTASLARTGMSNTAAAEQILSAGARILQIRHKGQITVDLQKELERIHAMARACGALLIVNDRADVAALMGVGLHLGQDDLLPTDARRITGLDAVIGLSTHNADQLRAADAQPVEYLAIGPVFSTLSKDKPDPVVGLDGVREVRKLTAKPLCAIGGITRENALDVIEAGADSVAVIGDLYSSDNLRVRVREWIALLG